MSNINALALFNQKESEFSVMGAQLTRFRNDCMTAINRAINRINVGTNQETHIETIADFNPDTTIGLDALYEPYLSDAVTVELVKLGQRPPKKEFEITYRDLVAKLPDELDMIRTNMLNDEQDADTDEEESFIGMNRH